MHKIICSMTNKNKWHKQNQVHILHAMKNHVMHCEPQQYSTLPHSPFSLTESTINIQQST